MQKEEQTRHDHTHLFNNDIKRLQDQVSTFHDILSHKEIASRLHYFDKSVEQDIAEIFGSPSQMLEAYEYAKLGEAAGWMNLPEEAQESGAQDLEEISLKQRSRVLERCITALKSSIRDLAKE